MVIRSGKARALAVLSLLAVVWLGACSSMQPAMEGAGQATAPAQALKSPSPQPVVQTAVPQSPPTEAEPAKSATAPPTVLPTPVPTSPPAATSTTVPEPAVPSSLASIVAGLDGLPIDEFFDESYRQLLLRDPEYLTSIGLSESFGLRDDRLRDLSGAYIRETQDLEVAILDLLRAYERAELTPQQQTSYDVYEWYLEGQVQGHQFTVNEYPLHHFLGSYHFELDALFSEIHPLDSRQNVEDWIARLSAVDDQVEQLLEGLRWREEENVIPPAFIIDLARRDMIRYLQMRYSDRATIKAESLPLYARFSRDIEEIDDLSAVERDAFREAALRTIEDVFIPAYVSLIDYLDHLHPMATDDAGVWKLPNGEEYYAYMLRQETSTNLTPAEIHDIGLAEVERIRKEMHQIFADLGYPEAASFRESMDRAIDKAGYYDISTQAGKDSYLAAIEALVEGADQAAAAVLDVRPQGEVIVVGGPAGGYYVPGAPDGSRPGSYHVGTEGNWRPRYSMPTIAYHEAIPGHHFQIALAQEMDLPLFRTDIVFNAYAEGWAMYGERLAWELGLYDDDPYGNLGRLQYELLRAVRLVTDTGIHALGWTREEAQTYMDEAMGASPGQSSQEVDRYVVLPAQATGYKIGLIRILVLRQRAMDQLGDQFDIKEFHNVVLGNGSMPLDLLEQVVQDYIDAKLASFSGGD
jgi:uncharacterized protein (DUF885 family)